MDLTWIVEIVLLVFMVSFVFVLIGVQFLPKEKADGEN
jgi:hypothetical protein